MEPPSAAQDEGDGHLDLEHHYWLRLNAVFDGRAARLRLRFANSLLRDAVAQRLIQEIGALFLQAAGARDVG